MVAVTKVIDLLDKPALVGWANKLGLKGIDLNEYYSETKGEGTKKHNEIEEYLKNGVLFDGCERLQKELEGFTVAGIEKSINNGFLVGRIDLILDKEGVKHIVDFKRSNRVYLKTKLQLSAYKHMYGADKICFINSDDFRITEIQVDTAKYFEIVKRLYQVHQLMKDLNEKL